MKPSTNSAPLVSTLVACYNQKRFVVETLESVRAQTHPNIELIVTDDCSTDGSQDVIRQWLDANWPHATFIARPRNGGVCAVCNDFIGRARGKYLALLAADDLWKPHKLQAQVDVFERDTGELGVVYSDADQINEFGEPLPRRFIESHRQFDRHPEGWIFEQFLYNNFIPAVSVMIRADCFRKVGRYDETLVFEDWDMWLRLARHYRFRCLPEPAACYRVVSNSMVRTRSHAISVSAEVMYIKCLNRGWLDAYPQYRNRVTESLRHLAYDWYKTNDPRRRWAMTSLLRQEFRRGHLAAWLSMQLGIPYSRFLKLHSLA